LAARTIPTLPTWTAGARVTSGRLVSMVNYQKFWADPPMFRMYQSIAQSIPNTTDTQITCDVSSYDTESGRAASTPWSYTIPAGQGGRWQLAWAAATVTNSTGARDSYIKANGSRITGSPTAGAAPSNDLSQSFGVTTVALSAGDVLALWLWQNSGGALNTATGGNNSSLFEGRLISLASP